MTFDEARAMAERLAKDHPDVMTYERWEVFHQCRTNRMESWWYDLNECRRRYIAYVQRAAARIECPQKAEASMQGGR